MFKLLGDVSYQVRWLGKLSAIAAGLHLFSSFAGETGDFLSKTFSRLVLNYRKVFGEIWDAISRLINIDISLYKSELTFASIILIPYVFNIRKIRFSGFLNDNYRILAALNFFSFITISSAFPTASMEMWAVWLTSAILSTSLSVAFIFSIYRDGRHLFNQRIAILIGLASLLIASFANLFILSFTPGFFEVDKKVAFTFLAAIASGIGLSLRVDGYYPFLVALIFYFILFSFDYFLRHLAPSIDAYLTGIGA